MEAEKLSTEDKIKMELAEALLMSPACDVKQNIDVVAAKWASRFEDMEAEVRMAYVSAGAFLVLIFAIMVLVRVF